jgi:hypothetical protein
VKVSELLEQRGLSSSDVSALLAEREIVNTKGRPYTDRSIRHLTTRGSEVPRAWGPVFELSDDELAPPPSSGRSQERPPKAPDGARIETPVRELVQSPTRIAGLYRFLGGMVATGAEPQVGRHTAAGIAKLWDESADPIAELWLKAAEQNPWAARFVNAMNAGGVMGDLAGAHVYLAGATLYIAGANIPAGAAVFAKWSAYRPVVVEHNDEPAAPEAANGSGPAGASDASAAPPLA